MKKLFSLTLLLSLALFSNAQSWKAIGGISPFGTTFEDEFTVLENNRPAIAYIVDPTNLLEVQLWNGSEWQMLPQVTPETVTEVEITHIGNHVIVGYYENATEYFVMEYDGTSWNQLGDIGVTSELQSSAKLVPGATPGELWFSHVNQALDADVKKWDGLTWSTHGTNIVGLTPFLYGAYMASEGSKVYAFSDDQSGPNCWLYTANETVPGFTQYGASEVTNDQVHMNMECTPGKLPTLGYVDLSGQNIINFVRPDGGGDFTVDETVTTPPGVLGNFDHAMGADDSIFVVYTTGGGNVEVLHQEGGTMFQYGGALTSGNPTRTYIEIFKNSDKPYVMYKEDVFPTIMTYNNIPTYSTDAGANDICQEEVNGSYMTSITFLDSDFDSVYVIPSSNTPALLTNGNITVTRTNAYSSASNQNQFSITASPEAGQSGVALVDLYVVDGLDTLTYPISITVNPLPNVNGGADVDVCDGNQTTLVGSGASTYLWDNGITDNVAFTPASTLTYTVTGTDANGCENTDAVLVTVNANPSFSVTTTNALCNGNTDGELNVSGLDNFTSYDITYTNGSTVGPATEFSTGIGEVNLFGFGAGTFTNVIMTHNLTGCSHTEAGPFVLSEPGAISNAPLLSDPLCFGVCDGQIDFIAAGGTSPYQYSIDNGSVYQAGSSFTGLCDGAYELIVQDVNGCTGGISTENLTEPTAVSYSPTITNASCNGVCDGQIDLAAGGGTPPYQYSINNGGAYQAGTNFSSLCAGSYDILILDNNGCTSSPNSEVVNEPTAVTYTPSLTDPLCNGGCDGQIDLLPTGGTAPYTYSINNGGAYQAPSTFNSLCAGNYDILIQDVLGCLSSPAVETLNEPSAVLYTPTLTDPSCNGICDGQIDLLALGGTPPYQFSINNGGMYQAGSIFNSQCDGTYDILIQDNNGCLSTPTQETLTEPTPLIPSVSGDLTLCDGDMTTLNGSASGGTPGYTYGWDQGVSDGIPFAPAIGTLTYTLTVTDNNGCIANDNLDITVNVLPTILAGGDITVCDGNLANLAGSGGVSYLWDNGITDGVDFTPSLGTTTYTVTGADVNGCENTDMADVIVNANPPVFTVATTNPSICSAADGSLLLNGLIPSTNYDVYYNNGAVQGPFALVSGTGGDITIPGLTADSYSDITVVNTNGCQTVDAGPYGLNDPSAPTVDAGTDMTICEGEPVTLTAVNSENALISWDNGILNGHTFFPTSTTTFTVTASSAGCTATDQVTITVNALPDVTLSVTDATCTAEDGVVTSSISNGLPPYDIYWSNGTTGGDINGLEPALYYINVTDDNGCYTMEVATVSSTAMTISGTKTDNNCPGDAIGAVDLTVSGSGPFTYHWSNGDITEDISSLTSGQYEVMVTDQNLCMSNASFVIQEPMPMYGELVSTNATCGLSDGSITSTVLGGTPAYIYQWKDDSGTDLTGETTSSLSAYGQGAYSLEITDVNGCTHELFGDISENNGPVVTVDSLIASTCANDGTINIDVNSAFAITSYLWNTGATTEDLTPTGSGQYHLTVEDVNGCFGVLAVNLPAVLPATNDICIVSVDENTNTNLIVWEKPVTDEIAYFNVYRESSIAGMFQLVDSISYNQVSEYNDTIAYPGLRSWRYRLGTVDTCGNESILSEAHKTMHITYNESGGVYNLAWDHYEGFPYSTYYIWEHTDALGWTEIDQVATTVTTYTQTPTDIVGIDYRVTINPPSTCTSTYKATDYNSSRSNKSEKSGATTNGPDDIGFEEANIEFEVYPNPSEGQFKIEMGEFNTYDLRIFDISGKVVYSETIDSQNALVDISHLESGAYLIKIKSNEGEGIKQLIKH